jgi:hypothetical protein
MNPSRPGDPLLRYPGGVDAPDSFFTGSIGEIRISNGALNDEEVRWLAAPN